MKVSLLRYCFKYNIVIENLRVSKIGRSGDGHENILCYSQFPRERGMPPQEGPRGEAAGLVRTREGGLNCGQGPLSWCLWEEQVRHGSTSNSTQAYFGQRG